MSSAHMIKYGRQPLFIRKDQYHLLGVLIGEVKESSGSGAYTPPQHGGIYPAP